MTCLNFSKGHGSCVSLVLPIYYLLLKLYYVNYTANPQYYNINFVNNLVGVVFTAGKLEVV